MLDVLNVKQISLNSKVNKSSWLLTFGTIVNSIGLKQDCEYSRIWDSVCIYI